MELRLYNIPDDVYQQITLRATELGLSPSEYAKSLIMQNNDEQSKIIKKLVEKYATFDVKKTAELELQHFRLKGIVEHYRSECHKLMSQVDQYKLDLETLNLIMRYSDLLDMIKTYLTTIPEDKALVQQLMDEIKTLNERCDEISLVQKIKLKKTIKQEVNQ